MIEEITEKEKTTSSNDNQRTRKNSGDFVISSVYTLVGRTEVPVWINDNEYLANFHRPIMPSFSLCLKSLFRIHSETGNIWTHFLGFIFFLIAAVGFYDALITHKYFKNSENVSFVEYIKSCLLFWNPAYWSASVKMKNKFSRMKGRFKSISQCLNYEEHLVIGAFFVSGALCLAASTVYHTFLCYSKKTQMFLALLDYSCILVLQVGSIGPMYYYAFICHKKLQVTYILAIYLLCFGFLYLIIKDKLSREARTYGFIVTGVLSSSPIIHAIYLNGFSYVYHFLKLDLLILTGVLYIFGALMYTYRIPERYMPDYFNIWFQSHQILHVMVVFALFVYLRIIYTLARNKCLGSFKCN